MNILKNRNNVITYTVNKAVNTNLYISVQNGEVVINAPWYMASSQIQKIVEEKKQWILNKINEHEKEVEKRKEYTKIKTVQLLGKEYDLKIKYKNVLAPNLDVESQEIKIILPNKYKKIDNTKILEIIMDKMYSKIADRELEKIMEKVRLMLGIAPEDYKIKKMDKQLAKCLNSVIYINPMISIYKKEIIEYIILHEFCHLKYKNHTKSFYNMIETYMPNYEEYKEEVNNLKY